MSGKRITYKYVKEIVNNLNDYALEEGYTVGLDFVPYNEYYQLRVVVMTDKHPTLEKGAMLTSIPGRLVSTREGLDYAYRTRYAELPQQTKGESKIEFHDLPDGLELEEYWSESCMRRRYTVVKSTNGAAYGLQRQVRAWARKHGMSSLLTKEGVFVLVWLQKGVNNMFLTDEDTYKDRTDEWNEDPDLSLPTIDQIKAGHGGKGAYKGISYRSTNKNMSDIGYVFTLSDVAFSELDESWLELRGWNTGHAIVDGQDWHDLADFLTDFPTTWNGVDSKGWDVAITKADGSKAGTYMLAKTKDGKIRLDG